MSSKPSRLALGVAVTVAMLGNPRPAGAQELVRVAAVHFPPYVLEPEAGADAGLLPELLAALNRMQDRYQFKVVPTSLPRRFQDLRQGRVDVAMFENPRWGWDTISYTAVDMGIEDAEVFVARHLEGRDERYFSRLTDKRLALYSGYHYAFASFNADPAYLASHYKATLTYSHDSNLLMVARNRADLALVTRSYLNRFFKENPELKDRLMVSRRTDQLYHHYAMVRPDSPLAGKALASLFEQLHANGELSRIFAPYGITVLPQVDGTAVIEHRAP